MFSMAKAREPGVQRGSLLELSCAEKARLHPGGHQCHQFPVTANPDGANLSVICPLESGLGPPIFFNNMFMWMELSHKTFLSFLR